MAERRIYLKKTEFTGYKIKKGYRINNLKKYGFTKTEPADINPWWQRPFDITWNILGTWNSELLVSRDDRKLLMKTTEGCDIKNLQETLNQMIEDGVLESV